MNLKQMRLESGMKAIKIAEILGISRMQLQNLENRKYKLTKSKVEKLSSIYQKSEMEIVLAAGGIKND